MRNIAYKKYIENFNKNVFKNGIYAIRHLQKPNTYYVGSSFRKSNKGMYGRWAEHISTLRNQIHKNPHLQNVYNKYGEDGLRFRLIEVCNNEDEIRKLEEEYIKEYNSYKNGYNLTDNTSYPKFSKEKLNEYSKRMKNNNPMHDPKIVKKMIQTKKEINSGINILQYSKSGKFIKEYSSIKEASNRIDVDSSNIVRSANGETKSCGGYIWIRKEEFTKDILKNKIENLKNRKTPKFKNSDYDTRRIKVQKCDLDGNIIEEYDSIKQAGEETKADSTNISRCLNGNQKTSGGFIWKKK